MTSSEDLIRDWPKAFGFENVEIGGADGTRLRLVMGGPKSGRPVVLLHGAPQLSYCWRHVMPRLTETYRVIAPDLRGYGASALPRTGRYDLDILVEDLRIVLEWARARYEEGLAAKGGERPSDLRALLVGHDWGAPIAWAFAERHPGMLRHLIAVNGPHLGAYLQEIIHPRQLVRSWYVLLFQIPFVDVWIERSEAKLFLWMMKSSAPEGTFSEQDLEVYRTAFSRPGRARAVLAYYRQALQRKELFQERLRLHRRPRVTVPSTVVWGDADMALHPRQAERITRFVERVEVRRLPGVSHWVPEERPEAVAQAIIDADRASSPE